MPLLGPAWPEGLLNTALLPGINLVSYPGATVPAAVATSALLLPLVSGASFVARVASAGEGRAARFEVYLPEMAEPFAIEAGRGYLVVVPQATTLAWPGE